MLNEYIILIMLTMFAMEDARKSHIHIVPAVGFLLLGIGICLLGEGPDCTEAAGGALVGIFLLCISRITGESLGYGDGLVFLVTGIYLGMWENLQLLFISLIFASIFSAICIIKWKTSAKMEIPFLPFVWGAHFLHMGGLWCEKIL